MTLPILPGMTINVRTPEGLATRIVTDTTPDAILYDGGLVLRASDRYNVDYSAMTTVDLTLREIARAFGIADEDAIELVGALGHWVLVHADGPNALCIVAHVPAGRLDMKSVLSALWQGAHADVEPESAPAETATAETATAEPAPKNPIPKKPASAKPTPKDS